MDSACSHVFVRDVGPVTLRSATILLGAKLSGKSTLIQSLLLLKQTVHAPDRTVLLNFGKGEADVPHQGATGQPQSSLEFNLQRDNIANRKFTNTRIYLLVAPDEPFCSEVGCDWLVVVCWVAWL